MYGVLTDNGAFFLDYVCACVMTTQSNGKLGSAPVIEKANHLATSHVEDGSEIVHGREETGRKEASDCNVIFSTSSSHCLATVQGERGNVSMDRSDVTRSSDRN